MAISNKPDPDINAFKSASLANESMSLHIPLPPLLGFYVAFWENLPTKFKSPSAHGSG